MESYEKIIQIYQKVFSTEKLRNDLLECLEENASGFYTKTEKDYFIIDIYTKETLVYEKIVINPKNEVITPLCYFSSYEYGENFYYDIIVGLGEYTEQFPSFTIEKCLAKFYYNFDGSLYNIDFYIEEMNKVK